MEDTMNKMFITNDEAILDRDLYHLKLYIKGGYTIDVDNVIDHSNDYVFLKIRFINIYERIEYKYVKLEDISQIEVSNLKAPRAEVKNEQLS